MEVKEIKTNWLKKELYGKTFKSPQKPVLYFGSEGIKKYKKLFQVYTKI